MVDVEIFAKPVAGSSHVSLEAGNVLFISDVAINGEKMICRDPEFDAWMETHKDGDVFCRERPLMALNLEGVMTLALRHLHHTSYEYIMSLGVDHWEYESTQEEMTVFVRGFVVNVLEPVMA